MSEERSPQDESLFGAVVAGLLDVRTEDPVRLRRGRLVSLVLLVTLGVTALWLVMVGALALFTMREGPGGGAFGRLGGMVLILGATYVLNRRSASSLAGLILALAALAGSLVVLVAEGPFTPSVIGLTVPVLIAGLLGPPVSAFALATLAGLAYGWLNVQQNPAYFSELATGGGGTETLIVYLNLYIIAALGWLFSQMAGRAIRESHAKVQALLRRQEKLLAQVERQALSLRATTGVARALAGSRELDDLLRQGVALVDRFFHFDGIHLFLIDDARENAVLRASSSEAGRELLARGHQLAVGSVSVVGQAADRGEAVIGDETSVDLLLQRLESARQIRCEVGVPLVMGDEVIGVLHLQSAQVGAFEADDLPSLRALADQIAVAVANARLLEEAQRHLRELGELSREATRRGWRTYVLGRGEEDRVFRHGSSDRKWVVRQEGIVKKVVETGEMVFGEGGGDGVPGYLAVPMTLRGEVVGVVGVEVDGARQWTQDDFTIMQSIADRATLAVENARLFEQAHRTAQREQLINTIASRLQRAPNLRTLLEGVAEELSEALGADEVYAEFTLHELPAAEADGGLGRWRRDDDTGTWTVVSPNGDGPDEQVDVQPHEDESLRSGAR